MGVKGYLYNIKKNCKKSYTEGIILDEIDVLLIDGNCILHQSLQEFDHIINPDIESIMKTTINNFENILGMFNKSNNFKIIIFFDGIPPIPKQFCQLKRRENSYSLNVLLLPNTKLMNRLEQIIISRFNSVYCFINGCTIKGEGEHKIFNSSFFNFSDNSKILIISFDSDVVILAQLLNKKYIYVFVPTFDMTIDIEKLNNIFDQKGLINLSENNFNRLYLFCVLCGNDFFPKIYDMKELNSLEIFKFLCKNSYVNSFNDISTLECTLGGCIENHVKIYVELWTWYMEYFKYRKTISTIAYQLEDTPCCFCISKYLSSNKKISFDEYKNDKDIHLNYVLTNDFFKDELIY